MLQDIELLENGSILKGLRFPHKINKVTQIVITAGLFVYLCRTMKRLYLIIILMTFSLPGFSNEYKVYGPQGGLAMEVTLGHKVAGLIVDTDKPQVEALYSRLGFIRISSGIQ